MSETLVRLGGDGETTPTGSTYSCPQCGTFLDAPRIHLPSGDLARKCAACGDWYPVAVAADAFTE